MSAFLTPCASPQCGVATRERYCDDCRPLATKERNQRPRAALSKGGGGYGRAHDRWRRLVLAADPVCRWDVGNGRHCLRPGTQADHVIPLSVAPEKRYDLGNGQSLCASHHTAKTNEEKRGVYFDTRKGRAVGSVA